MFRSSTIAVFVDSVPFVDYYSPFWGPKAISMVVELQGGLTCRSSSITVWADSGPFHGLLLTDLRSLSDFHDWRTPWCVYVSLINNPRFYRFRALSWTITHRFAVPKRFRCLSNPKMCLRAGRQDSQIVSILARFLDYYSVLVSRSDFHD